MNILLHLTSEIAIDGHTLLKARHHPAAGGHHSFPVEVGKHLYEGVDEGLLGVMRGPVSIPLGHAPHKKVQGIQAL